MENVKIPEGLAVLLQKADFISVGTSDENGQPSVASKFLLKVEGNNIYLVDLIKGKTWRNLRYNPLISLSVMDEDNLRGYQINGTVLALDSGNDFDTLMLEFADKQVSFATNKIISGVQQAKPHADSVFASNKAKVFYKVSVSETLEIGPLVKLKKEEISEEQGIVPLIIGFKSRFPRRLRIITEKNKWLTVVLSFASIFLIGFIDYITGAEVELSILLLFPILAVTIIAGKKAASTVMFAGATVWVLTEEASRGWQFPWGIVLWNAVIRLIFFMLIVNLVSALKGKMEKEKEMARSDFLTGIANSRHFSEMLSMELKRLARDGRPFTLAYIDVDNFKSVNDSAGHKAGDVLLRLIADTIKRSVREIDVAGRLGGDEFALLFPLTGQDQARVVMERMNSALMESVARGRYDVTFSAGVVTFDSAAASADEAIMIADNSMYEAKKNGKNAVRYGNFNGQSGV